MGACEDVFVTKLKADGSGLAYSTFLRGSDRETAVRIAVDAAGAAYITGFTLSTDFPTTVGAYSRSAKGGNCVMPPGNQVKCPDAFIAKIAPDGASLAYSTYLGGDRMDVGAAIAIDASGAAYVSGFSNSDDLPTSATAFQKTYGAGSCYASLMPCFDAIVAKLAPDGASLAYLTYLGGSGQELGGAIVVDSAGNAVVTGATSSANFPTTAGVVGASHSAGTQDDIYVAKLNATGSALIFSTLVGGTGTDWPIAMTVDASGAVFVAGMTSSPDFPTTSGAYQTSYAGPSSANCMFEFAVPNCGDAFVFKLAPGATSLVFSTYLGGTGNDSARGLALDSAQHVWVTGASQSFDFPYSSDAYYTQGFGFLAELSADGKQLLYSSALRGASTGGTDLAIDSTDTLTLLGISNNDAQPATPGAYSAGTGGALVMRFATGAAPAIHLSATTLSFGTQNIHSVGAAQTVVVSNPSATPLQLTVVPAASTSAFLQTSDCPPTLAPSQSCNVAIRFQPLVSGNAGATLAINSNAPGSPSTVTLNGAGIDNQSASFVPGALTFPDQQAGTTGPRATSSLQSQATDVYALLKTVTLGGANPGDFDVNLSSCTVGGAYCTVDAAFKPQAGSTGTRSATVSLGVNAYGSPFVLTLTGTVRDRRDADRQPGGGGFQQRVDQQFEPAVDQPAQQRRRRDHGSRRSRFRAPATASLVAAPARRRRSRWPHKASAASSCNCSRRPQAHARAC